MGQIAEQIDGKLSRIEEAGGKPSFINAGSETERKLREELEDENVMAGSGNGTILPSPDEYPLKYRGLIVVEAHGEAVDFLSVTYINVSGKQMEM